LTVSAALLRTKEIVMKRCATLALLALITASAASAADPVELSAFIALARPEPTLQVRYGADPPQGMGSAQGLFNKPRQLGRSVNIGLTASNLTLFCGHFRLAWLLNAIGTRMPDECTLLDGTDHQLRDGQCG
jgi:hypothetical protein